MHRKWLIILSIIHISECLLTLTLSCFLSSLPGNGSFWMFISLSWWFLSGFVLNTLFWRWARIAGYTYRFLTASHCMLGGLLWRMYLLKNADSHMSQADDETRKRNSILRLEVVTLKTCLSFFQTYPVLYMCSLYSTSSYFNPIMGLLLTFIVAIIVASSCFCVLVYVGDCVGDMKPNWLSVLEPSVIATNSNSESSTRLLILVRFLVFSQSFVFEVGRLVTITSLSNLLGLAVFVPLVLVRLSLAGFCLAKNMYAELGLTSWDLRRHSTAIGRLLYLSYLTLFDWQVNRDNQRGTNLVANAKTKQAVIYYALSTAESVAVTVIWSLTSCNNIGDNDWFRGARFASIAIACNLVSAVLIVFILMMLHWDNLRVIPRIETFNCDDRTTDMLGCSNPAMDYTENGLSNVTEPNPKTTSSYVDFKDLDDDEVVLFVAKPNGKKHSSEISVTEGTSSGLTNHNPVRLIKQSNQNNNSRSCKMGLHSLLLRRDTTFPNNVVPAEVKNRLLERRKSYEVVTTMVSRAEFGFVVEKESRLAFRENQLSVESLNSPYARSIRTMSWPIMLPLCKATLSQTVLPLKWEAEQTPNEDASCSNIEIPRNTSEDKSDDVFYV